MTSGAADIPAGQQFRAIAYLRWCLFRNGFRRKGGVGEVVARVIVYPIFAAFVIGPVIAATASAYAAVSTGHPELLTLAFWVIFGLQILTSINISQPGLSFDPESLIRFPVTFPRYLVVRVFLGLLSASTIIGTCALLGAAAGASFARPAVALPAFGAALALALTNMLLIRMVFAWVDRWLATRRARELVMGFLILFGIGAQYVNFTFNPGFNHGDTERSAAKLAAGLRFYDAARPLLDHLPPSLAAHAILESLAGSQALALLPLAGILLYAAAFLAVFAWRMQREYRGENLSEVTHTAPAPGVEAARAPAGGRIGGEARGQAGGSGRLLGFSPGTSACLYKEWIYLRRNTTQLYGLLAPLAMVFLVTLRFSNMARATWIFPAAVAYATLGIAALSYNAFGLDAAGIQFYFLAPVSLGEVLLAKNLFGFLISALEIAIILSLIAYSSGMPPLWTVLSTLLWAAFATLVNVTIGNRRSLTTPKKMDPGKLSRRQASQMSALMSLGLTLAMAAFGLGLIFGAGYLGMDWLPVPILLVLAVGAFALYWTSLKKMDGLGMRNREVLIEELCKAS